MTLINTHVLSFILLHSVTGTEDTQNWINVCYFTNWARYRTGLINKNMDVFEMGLDPDLCTHFMYGFGNVVRDTGIGSYKIVSFDPNADHPSGHAQQDGLCLDVCNDPDFKPDWNDPNGVRCDWPCNPSRVLRGYEGLNVGMKRKKSSIKSLISVGGWNFNDCTASPFDTSGQGSATCQIFSEIASSSEDDIQRFAANIIVFCRKWGFDGFDLDWEYPVVAGHNTLEKQENGDFKETPADFQNYINMLRILKEAFLAEGVDGVPLLLTAAVGVGKTTADTAYDIPQMTQHLDLVNLMTYDLHGAWSTRTGCNANLYSTAEDLELEGPVSVSWAVNYWLDKGAPASKLTMGLPTYGRGWTLQDAANNGYNAPATGPSPKGISTKEDGYLSYYEILEVLGAGARSTYDEDRQCPYVINDGRWIGYDNDRSLCAKLNFAKSRGLAGSMVWALDLDDFDGSHSGGQSFPLVRLASQGGQACPSLPSTATTTAVNLPSTTTVSVAIGTTTVPLFPDTTTMPVGTTTTATSTFTTVRGVSTTQPVTTSFQMDGDVIQSGDTIFLRVRSGAGNHVDVQGSAVQSRWKSRGHWQALIIQKTSGGVINSGDTVYIQTHTGAHIDVQGEVVQARWQDQGVWQSMRIQKKSGISGAVLPNDVVCFKAHSGKQLDFGDVVARATGDSCGDSQAVLIEKEVDGAMFSGDSIHLLAHTGKRVDVQDGVVQARWSEAGEWQRLLLENYGGRSIFSGDVVFLKADTGDYIDVEAGAVQARWNDRGLWQQLVIEKKNGEGAVMPGDTVFLRAHTGKMIDVQNDAVQCRWLDRGSWQTFILEKSVSRRLSESSLATPIAVFV